MKRTKKMMAFIVALVLTITLVPAVQADAAPKMKLNKKSVTMNVGKTVTLKVQNKNGKKVKWKSTNNKVAKVTKKGKVTAKKIGKATIVAKVGNKKLKCRIVVKKKQNVQPVPTTKPVVTTKPVTTTKPTVTTKSAVTTKPQVTEKPIVTTQTPTTAPVVTTKPTVTTPVTTTKSEVTTAPSSDGAYTEDASIDKPFGIVANCETNNTITVVWGRGDIDLYNVYVDGVRVKEGVVCAAYVIENVAAGTHTVSVTTVVGNKESTKVGVTVTVTGSGSVVTTTENRQTTAGQVTTAQQTTTQSSSTGASGYNWDSVEYIGGEIANQYKVVAVEGNVSEIVNIQSPGFAAERGIYVTFPDADLGDMTVNGAPLGKSVEGAGVIMHLSSFTSMYSEVIIKKADGSMKAKLYVYNNGGNGGGAQTTTAASQTTTAAPQTTTKQQATTTSKTTTKPQETTTTVTFTTDASIEKPFGLVVDSPENGMVSIVWGAGSINCYNVYVDGERRRTGVSAQKFVLPVYFEGTHTIAITTVVGTKESLRTEATIAVTGVGEKETESETCPEELKPQLKSNVPLRDDRIVIELNNKTNGKYSDNEIYWCIVGNNSSNQLCYLDKDGNMVPASESLNTISVNGSMYANIYHTLAEADYVYAPTIRSGRMYISYGKPVYLKFVGSTGYAGPDMNNPGDVNADTLFEFAEFTIEGKNYWGNTTRVDYFCFPMITRLVGNALYGGYDKVVGDIGTREEIFNAFKSEAPEAFKTLVRDDRIIAPCKATFNSGQTYGNYFDNYINEFWTKYTNENLVFSTESGSFIGRVVGNQMKFTRTGDSTVYYVDKPTTQEVLEGKGAFDRGNSVEKAIEAQLCAAFNRGVATEPEKWYKPSEYYKNSINNFYAGFFHRHSVLGFAYGFCYDDVNDQSTLLQYDKADALVIDLKW